MPELSVIIGSVGVALLLIAFLLNLFGVLSQRSAVYSAVNVVGAGLSCWASLMIDYVPFVVLEGVWCLVAIVGLVRAVRGSGAEDR